MKEKKTNLIIAISLSLLAAIAGIIIFSTWDIKRGYNNAADSEAQPDC